MLSQSSDQDIKKTSSTSLLGQSIKVGLLTYISSPADEEFDKVFMASSTAKGESRIVVAVRLRIHIHAMELLGTRGAGVRCCCIGVDRNSCKSSNPPSKARPTTGCQH
jgi:hypothetical protein